MDALLSQLREGLAAFSRAASPPQPTNEVEELAEELRRELADGYSRPEVVRKESIDSLTRLRTTISALQGLSSETDVTVSSILQTFEEIQPVVPFLPEAALEEVVDKAIIGPLNHVIAEKKQNEVATAFLAGLVRQRTELEQQPAGSLTRTERQRILQQVNQEKEKYFAAALTQLGAALKDERSRLRSLDTPSASLLQEHFDKLSVTHGNTCSQRDKIAARRVTYRAEPDQIEQSLVALRHQLKTNEATLEEAIRTTLNLLQEHVAISTKIRTTELELQVRKEVESRVEEYRKHLVDELDSDASALHQSVSAVGTVKDRLELHVTAITGLCKQEQESIALRLKHTAEFYAKLYEEYWFHLDELAEGKRKCILRHEAEISRCETEQAEWEHIAYEESSATHLEELDKQLATHKSYKLTLEGEVHDLNRVMDSLKERGKEITTFIPTWTHPLEKVQERKWAKQKEVLENTIRRSTPAPSVDASVLSAEEDIEKLKLKLQIQQLQEQLDRGSPGSRQTARSPQHALEVVHLYEGQDVTDVSTVASASVVDPPSRRQLKRARQLKRSAPKGNFGTPPNKRR